MTLPRNSLLIYREPETRTLAEFGFGDTLAGQGGRAGAGVDGRGSYTMPGEWIDTGVVPYSTEESITMMRTGGARVQPGQTPDKPYYEQPGDISDKEIAEMTPKPSPVNPDGSENYPYPVDTPTLPKPPGGWEKWTGQIPEIYPDPVLPVTIPATTSTVTPQDVIVPETSTGGGSSTGGSSTGGSGGDFKTGIGETGIPAGSTDSGMLLDAINRLFAPQPVQGAMVPFTYAPGMEAGPAATGGSGKLIAWVLIILAAAGGYYYYRKRKGAK